MSCRGRGKRCEKSLSRHRRELSPREALPRRIGPEGKSQEARRATRRAPHPNYPTFWPRADYPTFCSSSRLRLIQLGSGPSMKRFRCAPRTPECESRAEIARASLPRSDVGGGVADGGVGRVPGAASDWDRGRDGRAGLDGPRRVDEGGGGRDEKDEDEAVGEVGLAGDERKSTGIRVCCSVSLVRC